MHGRLPGTTYEKGGELYGTGSFEQQAVLTAWREVGIRISGALAGGGTPRRRGMPAGGMPAGGREVDTLAALSKQIESLSAQVKRLIKDVGALKGRK